MKVDKQVVKGLIELCNGYVTLKNKEGENYVVKLPDKEEKDNMLKIERVHYSEYKQMQNDPTVLFLGQRGEYNKEDKTIGVHYAKLSDDAQKKLKKELEVLINRRRKGDLKKSEAGKIFDKMVLVVNKEKAKIYKEWAKDEKFNPDPSDFLYDYKGDFRAGSMDYLWKLQTQTKEIVDDFFSQETNEKAEEFQKIIYGMKYTKQEKATAKEKEDELNADKKNIEYVLNAMTRFSDDDFLREKIKEDYESARKYAAEINKDK